MGKGEGHCASLVNSLLVDTLCSTSMSVKCGCMCVCVSGLHQEGSQVDGSPHPPPDQRHHHHHAQKGARVFPCPLIIHMKFLVASGF